MENNEDRIISSISDKGVLTIPLSIRKMLGLPNGGQVAVSMTEKGALIAPVATFPIEIYSDRRLAEFGEEEQKLAGLKSLR